ncbi:MAG: restriction endonuclease subunit S [Candidatus Limnocylindrales bacterium]
MSLSYEPPAGWRFPTIEEIALREKGGIRIGPFGSALKKDEYSGAGIRVLGIEDVFPNRLDSARRKFIPESKFRELSQYTVKAGDILVTNMGTVGRTCVVPPDLEKSIISSHLIKVSLDLDVAWPAYISWMLNFSPLVVAQIEAKCHGAIMAGFNSGLLKELRIPLPPLPEQRRISEMLDRADALRAKRLSALAKLDALTQSIFLDMFGDPATNPRQWQTGTLGDVATFIGGGTPSRSRPEFFDGSICWATSKDMKCHYLEDTEEHITPEAISQSATKLVPAETILVVVKSKILAHSLPVAIARVPTCFGQDLKGIRVSDRCRPLFVTSSLRYGKQWLLGRARGINTEGLTLDHLRSFPLVLPPISLQDDFASRVASVERVEANQNRSMAELNSLFASLQYRASRGDL